VIALALWLANGMANHAIGAGAIAGLMIYLVFRRSRTPAAPLGRPLSPTDDEAG
jgi:hypothetical protein